VFGISRKDYIGKTDLEAGWHKDKADMFYEHDLLVWASGEPQTFIEEISGKKMRFRKVCVTSEDGKAKGIMGYAVDCCDPGACPIYSYGTIGKIKAKAELTDTAPVIPDE
jgi:hypothetical protein